VPQPVPELVETAGIVGRSQPVVLVQIRDVGDFGTQPSLDRSSGAARRFDLAEIAGKGQLPLVIQILIAQNQYRIAVDRLRDFACGFRLQLPTAVDAADFGDEQRVERLQGDRCRAAHRRASANSWSAAIRAVMSACRRAKPEFFSNVF
jgi:hypothetical protein